MLWKSFPDEVDTIALRLVYQVWKGESVDKAEAALAAFNVGGYATAKTLGQPAPTVFAAAGGTEDQQIEAAFQTAMFARNPGVASVGFNSWGLILKIAIKVLSELLG